MNFYLIILIVLLIVCVVLYVVTFRLFFNYKKILKEYKIAKGQIINIERIRGWGFNGARNDTGSLEGRITTVEYDVNGKLYTFKPNTCKSSDKVGDEYLVLYNIKEPSIARGYKGSRIAPFILLCVSGGFTLIFIFSCIFFVCMNLV